VVVVAFPATCSQVIIIIPATLAYKYPVVDMQRGRFRRKRPAAVLAAISIPLKDSECLARFHSYHVAMNLAYAFAARQLSP
jgi:hypothetical protein